MFSWLAFPAPSVPVFLLSSRPRSDPCLSRSAVTNTCANDHEPRGARRRGSWTPGDRWVLASALHIGSEIFMYKLHPWLPVVAVVINVDERERPFGHDADAIRWRVCGYDWNTGLQLWVASEIPGQALRHPSAMEWDPNGIRLAVGYEHGQFEVWNVRDGPTEPRVDACGHAQGGGARTPRFESPEVFVPGDGRSHPVEDIAWHGRRPWVSFVVASGQICLMDVERRCVLHFIQSPDRQPVYSLVSHPSRDLLAAGVDHRLVVYDWVTGSVVRVTMHRLAPIMRWMAATEDHIVTGIDGTVWDWDSATGHPQQLGTKNQRFWHVYVRHVEEEEEERTLAEGVFARAVMGDDEHVSSPGPGSEPKPKPEMRSVFVLIEQTTGSAYQWSVGSELLGEGEGIRSVLRRDLCARANIPYSSRLTFPATPQASEWMPGDCVSVWGSPRCPGRGALSSLAAWKFIGRDISFSLGPDTEC